MPVHSTSTSARLLTSFLDRRCKRSTSCAPRSVASYRPRSRALTPALSRSYRRRTRRRYAPIRTRLRVSVTDTFGREQIKVLRQLLAAAFIDQVAIRKDIAERSSNTSFAKLASTRGVPYRAFGIEEDLYIHPSSNLFHGPPPEFIVYNELHRTTKVWLKSTSQPCRDQFSYSGRRSNRLLIRVFQTLQRLRRSTRLGFRFSDGPSAPLANQWRPRLKRSRPRPLPRRAKLLAMFAKSSSCRASDRGRASNSNRFR